MNQNPRWRLSDLAFELLSPKNMFNYFAGVVWDLKGLSRNREWLRLPHTTSPKALNGILYFLPDLTTPIFRFCWMTGLWGILVFEGAVQKSQALIKSEMAKVFEGKLSRIRFWNRNWKQFREGKASLCRYYPGKGISLFIFLWTKQVKGWTSVKVFFWTETVYWGGRKNMNNDLRFFNYFLFTSSPYPPWKCPLKFKKRYLEGLKWKNVISEEAKRRLEMGENFHLMARRYFLGIDTGLTKE